jgi:hypothetical protein
MEETSSQGGAENFDQQRFILRFKAATGFTVVLEFGGLDALEKTREKIEGAGLKCEFIEKFNPRFDSADLFMDMRSPVCAAQFDLEDWI